MEDNKINIDICLGSSCFARGNSMNLELIQSYLQENNLTANVNFSGHLCEEACKKGPVLRIGDNVYERVTPQILKPILDSVFLKDSE